jgi:hypothetical protein
VCRHPVYVRGDRQAYRFQGAFSRISLLFTPKIEPPSTGMAAPLIHRSRSDATNSHVSHVVGLSDPLERLRRKCKVLDRGAHFCVTLCDRYAFAIDPLHDHADPASTPRPFKGHGRLAREFFWIRHQDSWVRHPRRSFVSPLNGIRFSHLRTATSTPVVPRQTMRKANHKARAAGSDTREATLKCIKKFVTYLRGFSTWYRGERDRNRRDVNGLRLRRLSCAKPSESSARQYQRGPLTQVALRVRVDVHDANRTLLEPLKRA